MLSTGVASVTFRKLNVSDIIQLAAEAELDGIEWGGDIHVPPSDIAMASKTGDATRKAGLKVLAYGSYFKLNYATNPEQDFKPVLETAAALGAPLIRVWCGDRSPDIADQTYYDRIIQYGKIMGNMCAQEGIRAAFEYHRNSLTENSRSARRVLKGINHPCVLTGWQPNPQLDHANNLRELQEVKPWLANIHVFHWKSNQRLLLKKGADEWSSYIGAIKQGDHALILEFVQGDGIQSFLKDAEALNEILDKCI